MLDDLPEETSIPFGALSGLWVLPGNLARYKKQTANPRQMKDSTIRQATRWRVASVSRSSREVVARRVIRGKFMTKPEGVRCSVSPDSLGASRCKVVGGHSYGLHACSLTLQTTSTVDCYNGRRVTKCPVKRPSYKCCELWLLLYYHVRV